MARDFNGSTQYLYWDAAHIDETAKLAVSAWLNTDGGTGDRAVHFRDGTNQGFNINVNGDSGTYIHFLGSTSGDYGANTSTRLKAATSNGTLYHVCGTVGATVSSQKNVLSAYLDGTAMTDTTGGSWSTGTDSDRLTIGRRSDAVGNYNGKTGEIAIWENYELTAEDAAWLAAGGSPWKINPQALVHYGPLTGSDASNEIDLISGKSATLVNAPSAYEHPPVQGTGNVIAITKSGVTGVTGSLAETTDNSTLAASGQVGEDVTGSLAETTDNSTLAASGTVGAIPVTGTLTVTTADSILVASGTAGSVIRDNDINLSTQFDLADINFPNGDL